MLNENLNQNTNETPDENESPSQVVTTENEMSEVELAKQKIENIRQKILGGDTTLTAEDLTKVRGELEFAELRIAARQERQEKQRQTERREKLLALQNQLAEVHTLEAFNKLLSESGKVLEKYLSKHVDRNAQIAKIETEMQNGAFVRGTVNFEPVEGIETNIGSSYRGDPTKIGKTEAVSFDPREKVEQFVYEILQKYFERRGR